MSPTYKIHSLRSSENCPEIQTKRANENRAFADAEYFGVQYRDVELVNGRWYFQRPRGRRSAFTFQSRVILLTEPSPQPRYPKLNGAM